MKLPGSARRAEQERLATLVEGAAVDIPCRLRRTSARGWSPWLTGLLRLPAASGSHPAEAAFVADTPADIALLSGRAGRTGPVPLRATLRPARRRVRFKGEAFHGPDAEIIVLRGDPATIEIAVAVAATEHVYARLTNLMTPAAPG